MLKRIAMVLSILLVAAAAGFRLGLAIHGQENTPGWKPSRAAPRRCRRRLGAGTRLESCLSTILDGGTPNGDGDSRDFRESPFAVAPTSDFETVTSQSADKELA